MANLRMCRRSGQSELKRHWVNCNCLTWMVANCWINWHLTVAKCTVSSGLSHRLCCNKTAVRICVAGCVDCTKTDPSLVRVVCKSLQLIYLSVLHLTLDIYIRIYTKTVSVKQAVLVLWLSTRGLNFCGPSHLQERAWQVMGFGSFWGQTGWPCSNQAKCKNCSEAVEIGAW